MTFVRNLAFYRGWSRLAGQGGKKGTDWSEMPSRGLRAEGRVVQFFVNCGILGLVAGPYVPCPGNGTAQDAGNQPAYPVRGGDVDGTHYGPRGLAGDPGG